MSGERWLPYEPDDDVRAKEFVGKAVNAQRPHTRIWPELLSGDYVEQTVRVLVTLKQDAMARFAKRREDVEALRTEKNAGRIRAEAFRDEEREYRRWHARAVRFDQAVSQRLREAKAALKDHNRRVYTDNPERTDVDHWKNLLAALAEAVHWHQDAIHPDDASPDDRLLWSRLDLIALPGDDGGVLRDLIRKRVARAEAERDAS